MKQIQQYFYFLVKLADYTGESWEWKKKNQSSVTETIVLISIK